MAIYLKNSWNVPPTRWGSFTDVKYAINENCEKIYSIDHKSLVLGIPMFWGLPVLDYSKSNKKGTLTKVFADFRGYHYNGTDSTLSFGNTLTVGDRDYTISALASLNNVSNTQVLVSKGVNALGGDSNALEYVLQFSATDAAFRFVISDRVNTINVVASITGVPVVKNTYLIVGVHDAINNKIHIYINGKYENTTNLTISQGNSIGGFNIGSWDLDSVEDKVLDGYIKDVRINTAVLSDSTISKFNELPYALYQKVPRPFYLLPIAAPEGWTGTINGISSANISKVNGISLSVINKINGI